MYTEWEHGDETAGMDEYSTVVQAKEPPPVDWPNMLGYQPTDEEGHWLVVWVFNHKGHELELLSDKAFRCPDQNCDARVRFTAKECYNCRWEVPESFHTVPISVNWPLYLMDQAFITSHVPVTCRQDLMDAVRWAGKADFEAAADMLFCCLGRNFDDPFTLAAMYGPALRIAMQHSQVWTELLEIDYLTTYSVNELLAGLQAIIDLSSDGPCSHLLLEATRKLGKLAIKYVHDMADNDIDIAPYHVSQETMDRAIEYYSEFRSTSRHVQSAVQDGMWYHFTFDSPHEPVRGAVEVYETSNLLEEIIDMATQATRKDAEQQHLAIGRIVADALEANAELDWLYSVADSNPQLLDQLRKEAEYLLIA